MISLVDFVMENQESLRNFAKWWYDQKEEYGEERFPFELDKQDWLAEYSEWLANK